MKTTRLVLKTLVIVGVLSSLLACAPKESLQPLYKPVDYKFEEISLDIPTVIDIAESFPVSPIRAFLYKIPLLGRIIAIPFDLTNALIPAIPLLNDDVTLAEEDMSMWADPEFLSIVKSVQIKEAWMREKTDEQLLLEGKELTKKKTQLCISKGISYIKNMDVTMEYQNRLEPYANVTKKPLAWTNNSKAFFTDQYPYILPDGKIQKTRRFKFHVEPVELVQYVRDINNFKLKLNVGGKIPCEGVYIEVGIVVRIVLDIKRAIL